MEAKPFKITHFIAGFLLSRWIAAAVGEGRFQPSSRCSRCWGQMKEYVVCLYLWPIVEVLSWGRREGAAEVGVSSTDVNFAIENQQQVPAVEMRRESWGVQGGAEVRRCLSAAPSGRACGAGGSFHAARPLPVLGQMVQ